MGALVLFGVASGVDGWERGSFAANGYDEWSPGGYNLGSVLLVEVVMTAIFLIVICGATAKKAAPAAAGAAIGLALTLIHLVSIPVSNTSVNPARSTSQAIFAGSDQLAQQVAVHEGAEHAADDRCDPEHPELGELVAPGEDRL